MYFELFWILISSLWTKEITSNLFYSFFFFSVPKLDFLSSLIKLPVAHLVIYIVVLKSVITTRTEKQFDTLVTLGTHLKARLNWLA